MYGHTVRVEGNRAKKEKYLIIDDMKYTFELTPAQLNAIMSMTNLVEEHAGGSMYEKALKKQVRLIDRMLEKNGWLRDNS